MGKINILDKQTANMIAAGEVVDRPSGALKELLENSIDAGATVIRVEIRAGGRTLLRVTDNGGGIMRDDVPKALLRHATSKISCGDDLFSVRTLGFRGEALAAISSVSRMEIVTCSDAESIGTKLISDENGIVMTDVGCPKGTVITVRDLFYNTPARALFMKKDTAEAASCAAVTERIALSHPDVSVCFVSENVEKFKTPGDGQPLSALYAVYGRSVASGLIKCSYSLGGITVEGFVNRPDVPRASRSMQVFFVNGRFVRSRTVQAALEEAYRSYIPSGKFPAGILNISMPFEKTDVNVHPAKLEIRFTAEKSVFEAVYYAVRNAVAGRDNAETVTDTAAESKPLTDAKPATISSSAAATDTAPSVLAGARQSFGGSKRSSGDGKYSSFRPSKPAVSYEVFIPDIGASDATEKIDPVMRVESPAADADMPFQQSILPEAEFKIIGEAYNTFVFVQQTDKIIVFDKHAAHERILYEQLSKRKEVASQQLLCGITVTLTREQAAVIAENAAYLADFGFECEAFGDDAVIVRAVPVALSKLGKIDGIIEEFARDLSSGGAVPFQQKVDRALYTVACKAAVKAGEITGEVHNEFIARRLLQDPSVRYCPHGRPVLREFSRRDLEKLFDR